MAGGLAQQTLTIYLINTGVAADAIVRPGSDHHPVRIRGRDSADLYVKRGRPHPPPWVTFFGGAAGDLSGIQGVTNSAVLLIGAARRHFAIAFGFGRHLLQPGVVDDRFGLKVTLNAVDHTQIHSVDRLTLDSPAPHSQIQAAKAATITDFGLDIDQDLLRAVTGNPRDTTLGTRLTGKDGLRTTGAFTLERLPSLLRQYLVESNKTEYRRHFAWVDHIREVKDPFLRNALDELVRDKVRGEDFDTMWLAIPERIDWQTIEAFTYSRAPKADRHTDIHLRVFRDTLRHPDTISVESLKLHRVYGISSDTDEIIHEWSVYQCLYAEIRHAGAQYLLNSGTWFLVDTTFQERIERSFQRVARRRVDLPNANVDEEEASYNRRVASADALTYALMDRKNVYYPDRRSPIEFCDLYGRAQELVHVKHYAGSSTLSHLFAQAVTSGTLFAQDAGFRRAVNQKLPPSHRIRRPNDPPAPRAYTVTYAIISASNRPLNIPFFSKVTLSHALKALAGLGYTTQLAKISVNP
jgi:uncharacterized protein (TIGR04141 family)